MALQTATIFGVHSAVFVRRALVVALGGAIGSVGRYVVGLWAAQAFGATFPWGTFTVNVVGSLLIGVLATLSDEVGTIGPQGRALLVVGVLGGFTTFSSFSLDTVRLVQENELVHAAAYVVGSLALSFVAVLAGIGLARALYR
jgi:fluoride exporter